MTELPKGWVFARLDELCEWSSGGTPRRSEPSYFNGEIPWVTISDLNDGVVSTTAECLTQAGILNSSAKLMPQGTVLVALYGSIGKLGIAQQPSTTNQAIACALPDAQAFDPLYLFHFLRSMRRELGALGTGVTQKNIYLGDIRRFLAPIAPRAEQTRIVAKLEGLLSDLDAGVAELKAARKKLQRYRLSLLKAAVEGMLTSLWREAQGSLDRPSETGAQLLQHILTERRFRWEAKQLASFKEQAKVPPDNWKEKYPEPTKPFTKDLPTLPNGWVWASVEQLGTVQLGRQRSPDKLRMISPVQYIRAANITEDGIDFNDVLKMDFSEHERSVFALSAGDVLLTEASGSAEHVGRPAIWPRVDGLYCFQNTVLRFKPEGVSSEFAFYSYLAMQKLGVFGKLSSGVGINHLSAGKFSLLPIALPSRAEQAEIVKVLTGKLEAVDEQNLAIELSLKQSAAQRQNILRAAFAGQLVPQDSSDESAAVLLERIRSERAERVKIPKIRKNRQMTETRVMVTNLVDVLAEAGEWIPAQEAFRRCGVADGAQTDEIELLYAELRVLDKNGRLAVLPVTDEQGRKLYDKLKLVA